MAIFNRGPEGGSQLSLKETGQEKIVIHTIPQNAVIYPNRSQWGWVTQSPVEADKLDRNMFRLRESVVVYRDRQKRTFKPNKEVYYPERTSRRTLYLSKPAA